MFMVDIRDLKDYNYIVFFIVEYFERVKLDLFW